MPLLNDDYTKTEKINGVIYNMSPSGGFAHGQVNGNIYHELRIQLKGSVCTVSVENLDLYLSDEEYAIPDIMLEDDTENSDYNADTVITLKAMPNISIALKDIFEGI